MDLQEVKNPSGIRSPKSRHDNVRSSCDNCTKSKVRCSKDQPRCQRCVHQGVHCKYSPSRKCRKRAISTIEPRRQPDLSLERSGERLPHFEDSLSALLPSHPTDIGELAIFVASVGEDSAEHMYEEGVRSSESNYGDYAKLSPFENNVDNLMQWVEPNEPLDHSLLRQDIELNHHDLSSCWTFPNHESPASVRDKPILHRRHSSPNSPCSHLAISAIQSLEAPFESCSLNSLDETTSSSGMARGLDTVLKVNRAAIDTILTILDCPCTTQEDLVFLIATIGFRSLSWYQASLSSGARNSHCNTTNSSVASTFVTSSSAGSSPPDIPSSADWVSIPSINFGFYALDAEHSDRMVAQLILAELSRIKEVIDKFASKYCARGEAISSLYSSRSSTRPDGSDNQLHLELEALLRSRLKRTIVTAREHLDRC